MKGDDELDAQDRRLASVQDGFQDSQRKIERVLEDYASILEDYRLLKSDLEEERSNRERYKRMARGQERNPFILMLIDGNEYIFSDAFIKAESEGGRQAALVLEETVRQSLPPNEREMELVIRVFADLSSISKALSRLRLVKQHSRSLADFTVAFSKAKDLFDYIDAGDEETTRYKIRENFRLLADNNQCKRVIFAGCHEPRYLDTLNSYRKRSDKLLLIKAVNWAPAFEKLGSPILRYGRVFRDTPLIASDLSAQRPSARPSAPPSIAPRVERSPSPWGGGSDRTATRKVRQDFPKNEELSERNLRHRDEMQVNTGASPRAFEFTRRVDPSAKSHVGIRSESPDDLRFANLANQLPRPHPDNENLIPLNADGERIDTFLDRPSPLDWDRFKRRAAATKVCNDYHLNADGCTRPNCGFNHRAIDEDEKLILRHLARELPCPRGSGCRWGDCYHGHVCVKDSCPGLGKGCRLKRYMHGISIAAREWVEPVPYTPKRPISRNKPRLEDRQSYHGFDSHQPHQRHSGIRDVHQTNTRSEIGFDGAYGNDFPGHSRPESLAADDEDRNFDSQINEDDTEKSALANRRVPSRQGDHESNYMDDAHSEKLISEFSPEQSLKQTSPQSPVQGHHQSIVDPVNPSALPGQSSSLKQGYDFPSQDEERVTHTDSSHAHLHESARDSERDSVGRSANSGSTKQVLSIHGDSFDDSRGDVHGDILCDVAGQQVMEENDRRAKSQSRTSTFQSKEVSLPVLGSKLTVSEASKPVQAKSRSELDFDSDHNSIPASDKHQSGHEAERPETPIMTVADIWAPEPNKEDKAQEELGSEQRELLNIIDDEFEETLSQQFDNSKTYDSNNQGRKMPQYSWNPPEAASQSSSPQLSQNQSNLSNKPSQHRSDDSRNARSKGWGDRADGSAFNAGWTDGMSNNDWNSPMPDFSQQQQQQQQKQKQKQIPQQQPQQHRQQQPRHHQQQQSGYVNPSRSHASSRAISNGGWEVASNNEGDSYDYEDGYNDENSHDSNAWGGKNYQEPYNAGRDPYRSNEYRASVPGANYVSENGRGGRGGGRGRGQRAGSKMGW